MIKKSVIEGQTLLDLAIEMTGSIEGLFLLLKENPSLNLVDPLVPGTVVTYKGDPIDSKVVSYFQNEKISVATYQDLPEPPAPPNPELLDYVERVQDLGSDVTGDLYTAYETLLASLASIRSKIVRLNLFAADGFAGIFAPLIIKSDLGVALGNSVDTNNNFVSGDYNLFTGLKGNAVSKFLQTGLNPDTITELGANDVGMMLYVSEIPGVGGTYYDIGGSLSYISVDNGGSPFIGVSSAGNSPSITPALGFHWVGRQNDVNIEMTLNGSNISVAQATIVESTTEFLIYARMTGSAFGHSNRRLMGYSITKYMTTSERAIFKTAIETFNTAIGR